MELQVVQSYISGYVYISRYPNNHITSSSKIQSKGDPHSDSETIQQNLRVKEFQYKPRWQPKIPKTPQSTSLTQDYRIDKNLLLSTQIEN